MHLIACQLYDFARLPDTKAHQRRTIEDHADVTRELIRADDGDQEITETRGPDHLNLASPHDKEWHVGLAAFDQHVPARDWTNSSVGGNPRDLRGTQDRKQERRVRGACEKCRPWRPGQHRQALWIACASGTSTRPMSPSTVTR